MKRKICRAIFFAELFSEIVSLLQTIWNLPIPIFEKSLKAHKKKE